MDCKIDKKGHKKFTKKQIIAIVIPVVTVAVLIAVIVPSVVWATNIFRISKVDKINIGDSQEQVIKILGEPYNKNEYGYEYYSDNYLKVLRQLDQLNGNERGLTAFESSDDDVDFGEDKETKLEEQLRKMTYQYIRVEFNSDKKVSSVLFDAEKCDSKEYKKVVKSYDVQGKTSIQQYDVFNLSYSVKYDDGSFYKSSVVNEICADFVKENVNWQDRYGNEYSIKINVTPITRLTSDIVKLVAGGDKSLLTEFEIPSNITSIDSDAFDGCDNLTTITMPTSAISSIPKKYLENVVISSGTSIGEYTFSKCSSLTSIEIPSSVTSISNWAFSGCSSLTSIVIPSSVTSIGVSAFSDCSSLTSIEIPSSVTSIGDYAFYKCSNLTSIVIPSSVTRIGFVAFEYCNSLTIYCEAERRPSEWDIYWNHSNRPVVWGYKK